MHEYNNTNYLKFLLISKTKLSWANLNDIFSRFLVFILKNN